MNLEKEIFDISLTDIIPNRFQPREIFKGEELKELSESIKQHGVIQPIIVRKVGDKYEIIAGERRFRASQLAGKETIPALVRDIDDKETAKIALLENLQRSNLTPIEEAKTYQTILKIENITQDELAQTLGKSQSAIANKLRLLTLNEEVQTALLNSQISERHARSLIGLPNERQVELLQKIINEKLTVRQLDEEIMRITGKQVDTMSEEESGGINMNNSLDNENMNMNQDPEAPAISAQSELLNTTIPGSTPENNVQEPSVPNNTEFSFFNTNPVKEENVIENTPSEINNIQESQAPVMPEINTMEESKDIMHSETTNPLPHEIELPTIETNPNQSETNGIDNNINAEKSVIDIPKISENNVQAPVTGEIKLPEISIEAPTSEVQTPEITIPEEVNSIEQNNQITMPEVPQSEINSTQEIPQRPENIFDRLRVNREDNQESKLDLKTPDLSTVINSASIEAPTNKVQTPEENQYNDIYDLRFAINNFRQAVQNTEKFGFKVNTQENDLNDKYQIVIEIDKK